MNLDSYGGIALLTWTPDRGFPRLTRAALDELRDLLFAIGRERIFDGVVIAANSESFAVGADLEEIFSLGAPEARAFALQGQQLFGRIERFSLPVVAAIRGFCLGGGLDLALACHWRVATYDSSVGHPGAALGLVTGWGGTGRLPRLIGRPAALLMMLTAERLPAAQALGIGLVDELVSSQDLIESAARHARRLAAPRSEKKVFRNLSPIE